MKWIILAAMLAVSGCNYAKSNATSDPYSPEAICQAMGYYPNDSAYGKCIDSEIASRQKLGMR